MTATAPPNLPTTGTMDDDARYRAICSRDARFDGRFFVGVTTTGIFCRCVCPARTPGRDRCQFFETAAAAMATGFRPCLRCRPEGAPGYAPIDRVETLAATVLDRIEDGALSEGTVGELAARLGVSERHLRRVTERAFGVTPVELAQAQRILLARRLLAETRLGVTEIALSSGFSSIRRFNAAFLATFGKSPSEMRRKSPTMDASLRFEIPFREPMDWDNLLAFLGQRALVGVESVADGVYSRTARVVDRTGAGRTGWVWVEKLAACPSLLVTLSASLCVSLIEIRARLKRVFDTDANPAAIHAQLGALADGAPGLRVPGAFDLFETITRAVLGQQISVAAASTLANRLSEKWGERVVTPFPELDRLAPNPETIASLSAETIASIGLPVKRAQTLVSLASAIVAGEIDLSGNTDLETVLASLKTIPGVGDWTAQYVALRALGHPDAFPAGDLGVLKALNLTRPADALARAEAWRPWRAYATLHLWRTLGNG